MEGCGAAERLRHYLGDVMRHLDDSLSPAIIDAAGSAPDFPDLDEIRKG